MPETQDEILEEVVNSEYKYGFVTDIEADNAPIGLTEETVRFISAKKEEPEWMLEWRLKAFRDWQKMTEPQWANVHFPKVDFQNIIYYSAPKPKKELYFSG
jgi:Fe-S cluster assembly protein SufB